MRYGDYLPQGILAVVVGGSVAGDLIIFAINRRKVYMLRVFCARCEEYECENQLVWL